MLWLFALLLPNILFGTITQCKNLAPIKAALREASEQDLIIFDVDSTLIIPDDMVLRPCGEEFFEWQYLDFSMRMSPEQLKFLGSKMLLQRSVSLVDGDFPALISGLQERKLKVIALTALFTGKFGAIQSIEDWRCQELRRVDIDFRPAFPFYNHIVFGDLMRNGSLPMFKDGVLFSYNHSKGEVLEAFLRRVHWQPKRVYFIDDDLKYLESVQIKMEGAGIEFVGFHYRAIDTFNDVFDEEVAKMQFSYLVEHEEWLSDEEAQALVLAQ